MKTKQQLIAERARVLPNDPDLEFQLKKFVDWDTYYCMRQHSSLPKTCQNKLKKRKVK